MVLRNTEVPQGDGGITGPASLPTDQLGSRAGRSRTGNTIFKSGPLFISSKGIGWTSWKKRWFILTRTSLVFFRSDPSALPQRGSELNLTLGGIDLNSSGSVVVRADKKLLTVLFPDGRDGRAFTLKAETSEDMYEWKTALENALAQAPSATLVMGQTGIFRNDATEAIEGSLDQCHQRPLKSLVVGRPVLLALEDIDGTPSFLEKALRFIEDCGVRVEGILRQSADVEEVKRRVHEYEQGKDEFSPDEDAHLVADCVKHILRELPSSPVPAACCTSLLEAFRSDRASRVDAMRSVISDKFPEPNRRLLLRILKMMRLVVSYKSENRMSTSAVAACMAPLLLRPLLAGDCQFEDDFRMGGDGSLQLLQAAAAANHAQAIVITLLEEYHNIFSDEDEPFTPQLYTDTEGSCSEDEEFTDDDMLEDDRYEDAENGLDLETEDDADCPLSGTCTDCSGSEGSDFENDETSEVPDLTESPKVDKDLEANDNGLKEIEIQDLKDFEVIYLGTETENSFDDNQKLSMEQYTLPQHGSTAQSRSNLQTETDKTYLQIEADKSNLEIEVPTVASPELLEALKDSRSPKVNSHLHHEADKPSLSSAESREFLAKTRSLKISKLKSASLKKSSSISKSIKKSNDISNAKRQAIWGRSSAQKNPSMESIDLSSEDEIEIQHLKVTKADLQKKIAREAEGNFVLQASLERRKEALHERRLALEAEVVRLQEQLQRERDLRSALEAGLGMPVGPLSLLSNIDAKTRAELEEVALAEEDVANLKEKVSDLHEQLNEERQNRHGCVGKSCGQHQDVSNNKTAQNLEGENVESLSKDVQPGAVCENVSKEEMPSSTNKPSLKRQQRSSSSTTGSTTDPSAKKQPSALLPTDPPSVECPRSTGPSTDSSTNNLPPQKPDANPSSVYNPKSTGPTAGSSTNKPAPQKQQSSSLGVNSPKSKADCENGMTNDQPSSTNMLAQTSSLNESNPKQKWHPSGSSAEGLVVVLLDTSTQKPTEATTSFPIDEPLTATPKSKASGTNSSNGEPLSAAPTGSIKKSAGKVEGLVSSSALSRLTYRFNFKKERRSQSVNELPPADPLSTSGSETTLPTGTPRTKSR